MWGTTASTSLPARGAWVEIRRIASVIGLLTSLPARGAWVEISDEIMQDFDLLCRSPHGERGLKFHGARTAERRAESLPARGAWVEIMISA